MRLRVSSAQPQPLPRLDSRCVGEVLATHATRLTHGVDHITSAITGCAEVEPEWPTGSGSDCDRPPATLRSIMRWLYHLVDRSTPRGELYAPGSLVREGFVHCSYAREVATSAAQHFPVGAELVVWRIDPRRLDVPVIVADTPRGPMPHVHGAIPADAIRDAHAPSTWSALPDRLTGHRVAFVAFEGMTLLDLVGVHDPVSRLRTMGFDPEVVTDIVGARSERVWRSDGATITVSQAAPPLESYDLVVIPGGLAARELARDEEVIAWLRQRPANRWWASVCTGSLMLGAAGLLKGRRATTHHTALDLLGAYEGVTAVRERVVRDGPVITAGGVTSGLDLGLLLVALLADEETARKVAAQMEYPRG